MSEPLEIVGMYCIDAQMLSVIGDGVRDEALDDIALSIGRQILGKFPPRESYVYYRKFEENFRAYAVTPEKLTAEELEAKGVYLRDVRLTWEIRVELPDNN